MAKVPTVKVKADNKQGFVVINEDDFNEKKYKLFKEPETKDPEESEEKKGSKPKLNKKSDLPPSEKKENPFD